MERELKAGSDIKAYNLIVHISCVLKHFFFLARVINRSDMAKDTSFHYSCLLLKTSFCPFLCITVQFFNKLVATWLKQLSANLIQYELSLLLHIDSHLEDC